MKNVVILGSTGSLGTQSIEILKKYNEYFKLIGLSAHTNAVLLHKQAKEFDVRNIALTSKDGSERLIELASLKEADIIINVLSGTAGTEATKAALKEGKTVLLGNKETLVAEGKLIMRLAKNGQIFSIDSEHNAIFEILKKYPNRKIKNIILPCSGGPFLNKSKKELEKITVKDALAHPKWNMGAKISIESATLINKGLEIIEAHHLFGLPLEQIKAVIHPECLVHGIVEFEDAKIAYISKPDMKEHIENALLHCIRINLDRDTRELNPSEFDFQEVPAKTLPGIQIVIENFKKYPQKMREFLNKEEITINKFLNKEINLPQIFEQLQP